MLLRLMVSGLGKILELGEYLNPDLNPEVEVLDPLPTDQERQPAHRDGLNGAA